MKRITRALGAMSLIIAAMVILKTDAMDPNVNGSLNLHITVISKTDLWKRKLDFYVPVDTLTNVLQVKDVVFNKSRYEYPIEKQHAFCEYKMFGYKDTRTKEIPNNAAILPFMKAHKSKHLIIEIDNK